MPNTAAVATYRVGNGPLQTQSGTSNTIGVYSFATPVLTHIDNGLVIEITKISNGVGCETTFTNKIVTLVVYAKPTLGTVTSAPALAGNATNIFLTGLIPNSSSVATYKVGNGSLQTQAGTSSTNGTFSFATPVLSLAANGLVVQITKILTSNGCQTNFTNKSTTLVVTN